MNIDRTFSLDKHSLPIIKQFVELLPGGFFIYQADGNEEFILVNSAMLRLTGCESEEEFKKLTSNSFRGFVYEEDLDTIEESIHNQINADEFEMDYVEYRIKDKNNEIRWIRDYGHYVHTEDFGNVFAVFVDDYTKQHYKEEAERQRNELEKHERESFLLERSYKDNLSGLENRWAFEEKKKSILLDESVGIIFCDLNGLKDTNDKLGHKAGDLIVTRFAGIVTQYFSLESCFRIGGDEFVVVEIEMSEDEFQYNAKKFSEDIENNNKIASIGIAYGQGNLEKIIEKAENLMYSDKAKYYSIASNDRRRRSDS